MIKKIEVKTLRRHTTPAVAPSSRSCSKLEPLI
jgi:hypothetical protein